jgi:hypothetical protein
LIEGSKTANIMLPKGTNVDTSQYIIIIFEWSATWPNKNLSWKIKVIHKDYPHPAIIKRHEWVV